MTAALCAAMRLLICLSLLVVGCSQPKPKVLPEPQSYGLGWQPIAPKRPQSSQGSGMFRYAPGTLPIPARPPRPDLPPEHRVQPAAAPN